jgi:hypothetical protein
MKFPCWPFVKTRVIKCSDGTERTIFKNPDDAFPLIARNYNKDFKAALLAIHELQGKLEGSLSGNFQNNISGFFAELDTANRNIQLALRAVYVTYCTNPCNLDNYLAKETHKILDQENKLRRLQLELQYIESLRLNGKSSNEIEQAMRSSLDKLSEEESKADSSIEFRNVKERISEWRARY